MTGAWAMETELLGILALGDRSTPSDRATLLARLGGGTDAQGLTIGERDGLIIGLREAVLGRGMLAQDACPACGEIMEFSLDTADLLAVDAVAPRPLRADGFDVSFRVPTSHDLTHAALDPDPRASLLAATVVSATHDGAPIDAALLPVTLQRELAERIAAADPLAEITLDLVCAECGNGWRSEFDPAEFVWKELRDWSLDLMRTVHVLARAYGWTEPDVLALAPERRRSYLELALDG